jgi:hypothetical protein
VIALAGAAEAVLGGKEKLLSAGEIPMVAVLSPTKFQSRIIHSYMRGVFNSSPILQAEVVEEKREGFKLKNGVELCVIAGDPRLCRGFSVIAALVDEIAMHGLSEEAHVRSDMELVRALRPSLASTQGRLLCVGTPYAAQGYAFNTFKRCYGNDDADVLVWNASSLLMNPSLNPKVVERAVAEDPVAANVEYCTSIGLFREDVELFISRAALEPLIIRGRLELPPRQEVRYSAFIDVSGGRHDDAALAIAHLEGRVVILDVMERHKAPHSPYQVVAEMTNTLKRYGINRAVGDAYAAEWARIAFQSHGINFRNATTSAFKEGAQARTRVPKPKSVLYAELLPRLHSGEVELLDHEILINQLCSLQRRTRSGGRDQIDHPPGPYRDDCSNVLAGVADLCSQRRVVAGAATEGRPLGDGSIRAGAMSLPTPEERFQRRQEQYREEMIRLQKGGSDPGAELWAKFMRQNGRSSFRGQQNPDIIELS